MNSAPLRFLFALFALATTFLIASPSHAISFTPGPNAFPGVSGVVKAADVTGDGLEDLIVADPGTNVFVYKNNGGGSWDPPVSWDISGEFSSIDVGDFDDDGDNDILIAATNVFVSGAAVVIWENSAVNGGFVALQNTPISSQPANEAYFLDANGDTYLDVAQSSAAVGIPSLQITTITMPFTLTALTGIPPGSGISHIGVGDFRNDGKDDIVLLRSGNWVIYDHNSAYSTDCASGIVPDTAIPVGSDSTANGVWALSAYAPLANGVSDGKNDFIVSTASGVNNSYIFPSDGFAIHAVEARRMRCLQIRGCMKPLSCPSLISMGMGLTMCWIPIHHST